MDPPAYQFNKEKEKYFKHLISLFEKEKLYEFTIEFGKLALKVCESASEFYLDGISYNSLKIDNFEESYLALTKLFQISKDKSLLKETLGRFVSDLCEKERVEVLCEFSFKGEMTNMINELLEEYAKNTDPMLQPNYYKIGYSFNVYKNNFRKAASMIYDYADVLRTESSVHALQEEVNAYLSAINALKLVNPEDAWLLNSKPPSKKIHFKFEQPTQIVQQKKPEKKISILDLEKNYLLCLSILKLHYIQHPNVDQIGPRLSAKEYFNLLVRNQLFNLAFSLAKIFEFDLSPVFEEITRKCLLDLPIDDSINDWSDPSHSINQNLTNWKLLER